MLLRKLRYKFIFATSLLTGTSLYGYFLHSKKVDDDNQQILKILQANSTIIALSNNQISKNYGPYLTSTMQNDKIFNLKDIKKLSFTLELRKGKVDENHQDFADLMVNCFKIDEEWIIMSLDIKFKNSNSNWLKLFENFVLNGKNFKNLSSNDIDNLINSNSLCDSKEYLINLVKQPIVLKSINCLLTDKNKLNNIGPPIKLLSHDTIKEKSAEYVSMKIKGKKRNAELIIVHETDRNSLALMYELQEDFMLSNSDLAKKYSNDVLNSIKNESKLNKLLSEINLSKLIEDKLLNNQRILNTIGKPIKFNVNLNEFKYLNENKAMLRIKISGKLNEGEFLINLNNDESWKVSNCDFKIIWRIEE